MTPFERAAKAVAEELVQQSDKSSPEHPEVDPKAIARAVLMAVREPEAEMTYAATEGECHEATAQDKAGENWVAMIDAILNEGGTPRTHAR